MAAIETQDSLELALTRGDREAVVRAYAALIEQYGDVNWHDVNVLISQRFSLAQVKRDAWKLYLYDR